MCGKKSLKKFNLVLIWKYFLSLSSFLVFLYRESGLDDFVNSVTIKGGMRTKLRLKVRSKWHTFYTLPIRLYRLLIPAYSRSDTKHCFYKFRLIETKRGNIGTRSVFWHDGYSFEI